MKRFLVFIFLTTTYSFFTGFVNTQSSIDFARQCLLPEGRLTIDSMFFTPDQSYVLKRVLLGLIDAEVTKIECALFRITDLDITQALINAHKRGVQVEIVVDDGALGLEYYSMVSALESHGIDIYVYQPVELFNASNNYGKPLRNVMMKRGFAKSYKSIMHHKTFIFYNSMGASVITYGSLNPTHAAFHGNEEVVCIRSESNFVERWKKHFVKLKRRCIKREYSA